MADSQDVKSPIFFYYPERRAVLRPRAIHVPRRLARTLQQLTYQDGFTLRWNDDFRAVMTACGQNRENGSWINPVMIDIFTAWFDAGGTWCLSILKDEVRVGGIYGVQLGGVYTAESMFSTIPNASSIALVALMAGFDKAGVELVDLQYANPHTQRFGIEEISHEKYLEELVRLKDKPVTLHAGYFDFAVVSEFVQSLTHTS